MRIHTYMGNDSSQNIHMYFVDLKGSALLA